MRVAAGTCGLPDLEGGPRRSMHLFRTRLSGAVLHAAALAWNLWSTRPRGFGA